jgi:hypothetical protein
MVIAILVPDATYATVAIVENDVYTFLLLYFFPNNSELAYL